MPDLCLPQGPYVTIHDLVWPNLAPEVTPPTHCPGAYFDDAQHFAQNPPQAQIGLKVRCSTN